MLELLLQALGSDFAAYGWEMDHFGADYGIVTISGGADFEADGVHCETGTKGFVDYFTKDPSSTPRTTIEAALNGVCAWYLNSVQFEEETGYIHYEWAVSAYGI